MTAFAGNSLLCRLALKQTSIDAASFTFIRIISGAIALRLIVRMRGRSLQKAGEVGGSPQGLTVEEIVYILVRAAEGAKHDATVQGDRHALQQHLRKLATLGIAAMKK